MRKHCLSTKFLHQETAVFYAVFGILFNIFERTFCENTEAVCLEVFCKKRLLAVTVFVKSCITDETIYLRMDQLKFVKDSLYKILLGPLLITFVSDVWQSPKYASEDLVFVLLCPLDVRVTEKVTAVVNVLSSAVLRYLVTSVIYLDIKF